MLDLPTDWLPRKTILILTLPDAVLAELFILIRWYNQSVTSTCRTYPSIIRRHPITRWAQRKDKIYLEVTLRDIVNEQIELTPTTLSFSGESDGKKYQFTFELYESVAKEQSKWNKTGFHLLFVLEKENQNAPFWPRLLKTNQKNQYIQIDWSKWVDEDEEEEDANKGLGGMDPSLMQSNPLSM